MKKTLFIAVIFFASFVSGNISGQQNTINTENVPKSESVIEDSKPGNGTSTNLIPNNTRDLNKDKAEDSAKESPDIQKTQKPLPIIKLPDKPVIGNGLMEINDGDFKYKRIPGISLNSEKPVETPIAENNTEVKFKDTKELSDVNDNKEKSSFGITRSTAVIVLLILLIVIIIVFKIRSKTAGDKNVLRRFPGMK